MTKLNSLTDDKQFYLTTKVHNSLLNNNYIKIIDVLLCFAKVSNNSVKITTDKTEIFYSMVLTD